jgi:hypothetical protein
LKDTYGESYFEISVGFFIPPKVQE